jgi:hypothetical protein
MANYRAIHAVCSAVTELLKLSWQPGLFSGADLDFAVYQTKNFETPMTNGVSLYLYHVNINQVRRVMPSPQAPATTRMRMPQLPLDLHFILTPWGRSPSMEMAILGWMMRVLEDFPALPLGLLSAITDAAFSEDETVELIAGQMSHEEMIRIWEVLPTDHRISVPYIARVVRIDSLREQGRGFVLERDLRFAKIETEDA